MNILILTIDSPFDMIGGLGMSIIMQTVNSVNNFISFGPCDSNKKGNLEHIEIDNFKQNMSKTEIEKFENDMVEIITYELCERNYKVDIIHVFDWYMKDLGKKLSERLNKKYVYTIALSTVYQIKDIYNFFSKVFPSESNVMLYNNQDVLNKLSLVEKDAIETAAGIVFVSEYYNKYYESLYPRYISKMNVIYNGINLDEYTVDIEKEYVIPGDNKFKVLYMGRYCMQKNSSFLLDVKLPEDMDLLFAGSIEGSQKSIYNRMLKECDCNDNKFFLGFLSGEKKLYFLKNVDAVIVPSIHEPFGIINLEVMAARTILLNSFSSGMQEYLDERFTMNCGMLPKTMEKCLEDVKNLSNIQREEMVRGNYELVKKFTSESQSKLYDKFYAKILKY